MTIASWIDPAWMTWRDRTIPKMAVAIREATRRPCTSCKTTGYVESHLPLCTKCDGHGYRDVNRGVCDPAAILALADALEESGCMDETVLTHLRNGNVHLHYCWVLDAIAKGAE